MYVQYIQPIVEKKEDEVQLLEQGHIYFFYRPKIDIETPKDLNDIQRLYIVLQPTATLTKQQTNEVIQQLEQQKEEENKEHHKKFTSEQPIQVCMMLHYI